MTTTTTVYTAPLSILPSIVSFFIPNAPIMSSATMYLSLLPPPQKSILCRLVVALMPPPLILLTLPPPLKAQPWLIEAPLPLVRWCLSSHLPLVHGLLLAGSHGTDLVPVLATRTPPEQAKIYAGSFPPDFQITEADLAFLAQLQDGHARVESVKGCDHLLAHRRNSGIDRWLRPGDSWSPRGGRSPRPWYWHSQRGAEEHGLRTRDRDLD